jgi:hypothetical protein
MWLQSGDIKNYCIVCLPKAMKWIHYIVLVNLESNSELNVSGSLIKSRYIKLSNIKKDS